MIRVLRNWNDVLVFQLAVAARRVYAGLCVGVLLNYHVSVFDLFIQRVVRMKDRSFIKVFTDIFHSGACV